MFLLAGAIFRASSAGSAAMPGPMAQSTIRLDYMSIAGAGCSRPCRVFTQVMPANRAMLGPSALNLRLTRSSTDSPPGCALLA